MDVFDCGASYGIPSQSRPLQDVPDVATFRNHMKRSGIRRAVVRRVEQHCGGPVIGNRLLADDVRNSGDLWGLWAILPPDTGEIPSPEAMPGEMKKNRIVGWTAYPYQSDAHFFDLHPRALGPYLEVAQERRIPLFLDFSMHITTEQVWRVLERFPELVVVLTAHTVWPCDRMIRPFLREFPHVYFELTRYYTDGGLEDLVEWGAADRLLFGSGFPACSFGGTLLMLRHARIDEAARAAIAAGNLERILGEVRHD